MILEVGLTRRLNRRKYVRPGSVRILQEILAVKGMFFADILFFNTERLLSYEHVAQYPKPRFESFAIKRESS